MAHTHHRRLLRLRRIVPAAVGMMAATLCLSARGDPGGAPTPPPSSSATPSGATTSAALPPGPMQPIKSTTPESAAQLGLSPLSATNTIDLHPSYTTIRPSGSSVIVDGRLGLWIPYVFIPGIQASHMGSLIVVNLFFESLHVPSQPSTPMPTPAINESGLGDLFIQDQAAYIFPWGGVALGASFWLPSATSRPFGTGKLQIGPLAAVGVSSVHNMLLTVTAINYLSVAGDATRPDTNLLQVTPTIGYLLPKAFFLRFDPVWSFDWKRGGFATIPVNLAVGHALTEHLLLFVQPEWVTTGTLKNSFTARVGLTYLGW